MISPFDFLIFGLIHIFYSKAVTAVQGLPHLGSTLGVPNWTHFVAKISKYRRARVPDSETKSEQLPSEQALQNNDISVLTKRFNSFTMYINELQFDKEHIIKLHRQFMVTLNNMKNNASELNYPETFEQHLQMIRRANILEKWLEVGKYNYGVTNSMKSTPLQSAVYSLVFRSIVHYSLKIIIIYFLMNFNYLPEYGISFIHKSISLKESLLIFTLSKVGSRLLLQRPYDSY